mmetsp:Transcript_82349/g.197497  ORF Transcript_82349/g.197497 Transcript_82349/m.197497 type:complete len:262 (-) Transcript_82349:8293-9078(-)
MGIREKEADGLLYGHGVQGLQVLTELIVTVTSGQRDLIELVARREGRQPRQRLLSAAADANQQGHTAGEADDAVQPQQVGQRIIEEHQVHRAVVAVVELQDAVEDGADGLPASQVLIDPWGRVRSIALHQNVQCIPEVTPHQRILQRNVRTLRELSLDDVVQLLLAEEGLVRVFVESVFIYPCALISPEPDQERPTVHHLRVCLANALEDAAQVPEREDVVELGRSWRQVLQHCLVEAHGHLRQLQTGLLHRIVESQEAVL